MSFHYANTNPSSYTRLHSTHNKPIIKFTYSTSPQPCLQHRMFNEPTPRFHIAHSCWQPHNKVQKKTAISVGVFRTKKRIFDLNNSPNFRTTNIINKHAQQDPQILNHHSQRRDLPKKRQIKNRKRIFSLAQRKQITLLPIPPFLPPQKCESFQALSQHSLLQTPQQLKPSTLNKNIIMQSTPIYSKPNPQNEFKQQIFEQVSPVKQQISLFSDKQNEPPSNIDIVDPFFFSSERFFDKETSSPQKNKISYDDVSLYDALANQIKHNQPTSQKELPQSYFARSVNNLYSQICSLQYTLPATLILLGLLLLIIQISK